MRELRREAEARGAAAPLAEVALRPMRPSDVEAVLGIERETFPVPWSERTFRNLLERDGAALIVAEGPPDPPLDHGPDDESMMCGAQAGEPGREAPRVLGYAVLWSAGGEAELGDLAVAPRARRRGIGRRLVAAVLEEARRLDARAVFLEVRESNAPAQRLYEAAGFRVVGRRKRYYARPPEDALVMRRSV